MLQLDWFDEAFEDLFVILDYISDDNPEVALKFHSELMEQIENLRIHPKMYKQGRLRGSREIPVKRNYIVVYVEDETTVSILRVLHATQQWPRP